MMVQRVIKRTTIQSWRRRDRWRTAAMGRRPESMGMSRLVTPKAIFVFDCRTKLRGRCAKGPIKVADAQAARLGDVELWSLPQRVITPAAARIASRGSTGTR